jgi:hypothetical protein
LLKCQSTIEPNTKQNSESSENYLVINTGVDMKRFCAFLFALLSLVSFEPGYSNEPGIDPFFGAQERKPRKKPVSSRVQVDGSQPSSSMPLSKILAGIGMFVFMAGGISMIAMAARQSQSAGKSTAKHPKNSGRGENGRFKLNEPYSENKNPLTKLVEPIRRNFESMPSDSLVNSDENVTNAPPLSEPMQAASEPVAIEAALDTTGIADVVDTDLPSNAGAAANSSEPVDSIIDGGETITSSPRLIREIEIKPIRRLPDLVQDVSSEETTIDSVRPVEQTPVQKVEFGSITETKPRLISAEETKKSIKSTSTKRKKPSPKGGGSDVA